jgi:redox-sensitive bicupin YhaK (pirin superfamily)
MLTKRDRSERGITNTNWLKSFHSFSFGRYHDPKYMGFSSLRVINEDYIDPGTGFGTHPHDNMEIITYVLKGQLTHQDSMGNGSNICPSEIQIMSAGTGVTHSERNVSESDEVHLLQIWITPNLQNQPPNYQQKLFDSHEMHNTFRIVVSPDGSNDSLTILQNAHMLVGKFDAGYTFDLKINPNRHYWLQMAQGVVDIHGNQILAGDGLAIKDEGSIKITSITGAEILLFDLP